MQQRDTAVRLVFAARVERRGKSSPACGRPHGHANPIRSNIDRKRYAGPACFRRMAGAARQPAVEIDDCPWTARRSGTELGLQSWWHGIKNGMRNPILMPFLYNPNEPDGFLKFFSTMGIWLAENETPQTGIQGVVPLVVCGGDFSRGTHRKGAPRTASFPLFWPNRKGGACPAKRTKEKYG